MGERFLFQDTRLWQSTLEPRPDDPDSGGRDTLRTAFFSMRERVKPLVAQIQNDCPNLTVHDVSHLDALWQTADQIVGKNYSVSPIEAFVFGSAVLIHDAAMALAAYRGGLEEIKKTKEWHDAVIPALRKSRIDVTDASIANPPPEILSATIFCVLRTLHAAQSERIVTLSWPDPVNSSTQFYLIENAELRDYYGSRIGRIAHSHHWDAGRLVSEFSRQVTAMVGLPEWNLNEVKVACMLRCADAAHIDARRAPRMLYAIKSPQGASEEHWRFQTKIGQIGVKENKLIYSSSAFDRRETGAWWLAYDVANMINGELESVRSILEECESQTFCVDEVESCHSPRAFARQLPVHGWEPVAAEVRVTDPVHLALTLGGRNLYGSGFRAPIRELFQNAVDAIRGRRGKREADAFPGTIRVSLIKAVSPNGSDELWVHIDDNGMGMTQRVLTGPLIDFGKSIWNSTLISEEYPGLSAVAARPIGKFGIGFFSAFVLGKDIRVISRRYNGGAADVRVLEFNSLDRRPILRKAVGDELPEDSCTRVSVKLESDTDLFGSGTPSDIYEYIVHLAAPLDINVSVKDTLKNRSYAHSYKWQDSNSDVFLDELLVFLDDDERSRIKKRYSPSIRLIEYEGKCYGRAALLLRDERTQVSFCEVEGVAYPATKPARYRTPSGLYETGYVNRHYVGVTKGSTDIVSRDSVIDEVHEEAFKKWVSDQAAFIDPKSHETLSLVPLSHYIINRGADSNNLPFCYAGGKFVTASAARNIISKTKKIHILLTKNYRDGLEWRNVKELTSSFFANSISENVFCSSLDSSDLYDEDTGREIYKSIPINLEKCQVEDMKIAEGSGALLAMVSEEWGEDLVFKIEHIDIVDGNLHIPAPARLVLTVARI